MTYIDPRCLKQIVLSFVDCSSGVAVPDVVGKHNYEFTGTGNREKVFRDHAEAMLPLVDKTQSVFRREVRTHLGMTQVLDSLVIRQTNGNYWKVAHYS